MVVDDLKNWCKYKWSNNLKQAFELLASPAAATWPDGRLELAGDRIVALPQRYLTRELHECRWEAHRRYIDIQYIVTGQERIGWALNTTLEPATALDEAKDVVFYTGSGDTITLREGMFAVFFPHDAHMPCMQVRERAQQVRKIVMKVALE